MGRGSRNTATATVTTEAPLRRLGRRHEVTEAERITPGSPAMEAAERRLNRELLNAPLAPQGSEIDQALRVYAPALVAAAGEDAAAAYQRMRVSGELTSVPFELDAETVASVAARRIAVVDGLAETVASRFWQRHPQYRPVTA